MANELPDVLTKRCLRISRRKRQRPVTPSRSIEISIGRFQDLYTQNIQRQLIFTQLRSY